MTEDDQKDPGAEVAVHAESSKQGFIDAANAILQDDDPAKQAELRPYEWATMQDDGALYTGSPDFMNILGTVDIASPPRVDGQVARSRLVVVTMPDGQPRVLDSRAKQAYDIPETGDLALSATNGVVVAVEAGALDRRDVLIRRNPDGKVMILAQTAGHTLRQDFEAVAKTAEQETGEQLPKEVVTKILGDVAVPDKILATPAAAETETPETPFDIQSALDNPDLLERALHDETLDVTTRSQLNELAETWAQIQAVERMNRVWDEEMTRHIHAMSEDGTQLRAATEQVERIYSNIRHTADMLVNVLGDSRQLSDVLTLRRQCKRLLEELKVAEDRVKTVTAGIFARFPGRAGTEGDFESSIRQVAAHYDTRPATTDDPQNLRAMADHLRTEGGDLPQMVARLRSELASMPHVSQAVRRLQLFDEIRRYILSASRVATQDRGSAALITWFNQVDTKYMRESQQGSRFDSAEYGQVPPLPDSIAIARRLSAVVATA